MRRSIINTSGNLRGMWWKDYTPKERSIIVGARVKKAWEKKSEEYKREWAMRLVEARKKKGGK